MRWAGGRVAKVAIPLLAGLVVVVLIYPLSRVDIIPVQCSSALGLGVPCESALSLATGAGVAVILGLFLWWRSRRAH